MKKKYLLPITILIISSAIISACQIPYINFTRGTGEIITETRNVAGFNKIRLDGAGRLFIKQGSSESLEIEAEENVMDELTSEVSGDTLILGYENRSWWRSIIPTSPIVYNLTVVDLNELTLNGAGDLNIENLETASFKITMNGAGQINVEGLMATDLSVRIAGTGTIAINGEARTQSISIDGAGNYQASDLKTSSTEITIDGLGNATIWATENLDITINGGGSLSYYGSPSVSQDVNGLGDIKSQGNK
ncbi:MAG: head GIN domain-containing protein [Anaerolineales bacterium]